MKSIRGFPFFILEIPKTLPWSTRVMPYIQAGLLTRGSSYLPRLPILRLQNSDILRFSSPLTAAGPSPILTGFPVRPKYGT